jgi:hypothetical protein
MNIDWNKNNTEKTTNEISLLYESSEYEKDLFVIFKYVTLCEKHIMYYEMRGVIINDVLRKKFIIDLVDLLINFRNKNSDIIYDTLSIKNKIMVISIVRKIFIIVKIVNINTQNSMLHFDKMNLPPLSDLITALNNIL